MIPVLTIAFKSSLEVSRVEFPLFCTATANAAPIICKYCLIDANLFQSDIKNLHLHILHTPGQLWRSRGTMSKLSDGNVKGVLSDLAVR